MSAEIPQSERSKEAVARVTPDLEYDLLRMGFTPGSAVHLRLFKEEGLLEVWLDQGAAFELFRLYPICTFSGELGPKLREGDRQAPEGFYRVRAGSLNPKSRFHLSFNLGFPNRYDRAHGRTGSALMIHGDCRSIGCYAMGDAAIEEIYALIENAMRAGQQVVEVRIFPFRMTDENLARHADSQWLDFWRNLREESDRFERERKPAAWSVRDLRYELAR